VKLLGGEQDLSAVTLLVCCVSPMLQCCPSALVLNERALLCFAAKALQLRRARELSANLCADLDQQSGYQLTSSL
jgi:hypothetical protein